MATRQITRRDRNAELVTIRVQRNEVRLLEAAIMDRKIMVQADHGEGRLTRAERNRILEALAEVERKVREAIR